MSIFEEALVSKTIVVVGSGLACAFNQYLMWSFKDSSCELAKTMNSAQRRLEFNRK